MPAMPASSSRINLYDRHHPHLSASALPNKHVLYLPISGCPLTVFARLVVSMLDYFLRRYLSRHIGAAWCVCNDTNFLMTGYDLQWRLISCIMMVYYVAVNVDLICCSEV